MKKNYKQIRKNIESNYQDNLTKVRTLSLLRFIDFTLIIIFLCMVSKSYLYIGLSILFIMIFLILIFIHDTYYKKVDNYENYLKILDIYNLRLNSKWDTLPNNGSKYINDKNIYLQDLDIIGNHSLYQYLCSAITLQGRKFLFECLSNKEIEERKLKERQEVIKELTNNIDFILEFQVYLSKLEDDINLEKNIEYLDKSFSNQAFLPLTILGNFLSLFILTLSLIHILPMSLFYATIMLKYIFSYLYSLYYKEELKEISILSKNAIKLTNILEYIIDCNFKSDKLKEIKNNTKKSIILIKKLDSMDGFSKIKDNFIANFIFNGIFTIDPYILYQYHKIKQNEKDYFKKTIQDISYLEAIISLSNIGILKDNICMPNRSTDIKLEFQDLKHPLLDEKICVPNSYKNKANANIITGSNMSGKTSFLRTIGINLILANSGTYTCASNFTSSYLKIFTSMRVADNIEKGISTFYGELLRIKEAISYQEKNKPMIVLIDEIFKGTNYNDRIMGATSVINKLKKDNVILMITTHDFELCDIPDIDNYYFTEYYVKDMIKFDYTIRIGKCTTTNAKYLMKRLNIIDEEE